MAMKSSAPLYHRNFLLHLQERQEYNRPVVLKELAHEQATSQQINHLHNEYVITRQLADVPGVRPVNAIEGSESHPILISEYIQGQRLSELIQGESLNLHQKLQLAVNIAKILSRIHEQKVMHKDICSSNILVAEDGGLYIIDFGVATSMRQERPSRASTNDALAGTMAYISPKQTDRMNRAVDYRTDMYSLCVTLYELFTGELPFQTGDSLMLVNM